MSVSELYLADLQTTVSAALAEDIGSGDISAALIPADRRARADVISRESAVICGTPWVDEVLRQLGNEAKLEWHCQDRDRIAPDQKVLSITGPARNLLTAERSALNFLQLLSGVATTARRYADQVSDYPVKLLDTRKTIPCLRRAQKYAVVCGGCHNHRMGLYDAFLIKENHIAACGSIGTAITQARSMHAGKPVEVEVENFDEFDQALDARADIIMLDNFTIADLARAVAINRARSGNPPALLEASGGVQEAELAAIAGTGVDYISIGALTKDARAIDLSMRFTLD